MEAIEFTLPLSMEIGTLIGPATKGLEKHYWVYAEIFPASAWTVVAATLTALSVAHLFATIYIREETSGSAWTVLDALCTSPLHLLQLSSPLESRRSLSTRVAIIVSCFFGYLAFAYYTCDLTARMTAEPPASPVKSFKDALDFGYSVVTVASSAAVDNLKGAPNTSDIKRYYDQKMLGNKEALLDSVDECLEAVVRRPKTLFFFSKSYADKRRGVAALKISDPVTNYLGFGLQHSAGPAQSRETTQRRLFGRKLGESAPNLRAESRSRLSALDLKYRIATRFLYISIYFPASESMFSRELHVQVNKNQKWCI